MRRGVLFLLAVFGLVLSSALVVAQAVPGGADNVYENDRGSFPIPAVDSVTLQSGNITLVGIDSNVSTYRWAGLLGNVSGNIVLGDSNNYQLYTWTGEGRIVYASTAGSVAWASLEDETEGDITPVLTYLASGADNYTATFTGVAENIGSGIFSTITSDYAPTNNLTAAPWKTYSLTDTTNFVWAGRVNAAQEDYSGGLVDFQMIIPEDGTGGDQASTTYNLWVELV